MRNIRYTFRMLKRNPLLAWITIPGLAVGLSAVLLLLVYLNHEISYDKHFPNKNRVLRLLNEVEDENSASNSMTYPICLRTSYTDLPGMVPGIQSAVQLYRGWQLHVKMEEEQFPGISGHYTDPEFFTVFGLPLIKGDAQKALVGPGKVVLTKSTAEKIFNTTGCIGKVITVDQEPHTVTGVVADMPYTSHLRFDMLISMESLNIEYLGGLEFFTYYLLQDGVDKNAAGQKIREANDKLMEGWAATFSTETWSHTELLKDIHMYTKADFDLVPKANLMILGIVCIIALFILIIALINYLNLYILHGESRIAEIASRKALGAERSVLASQFFTETGVIGLISLIVAFIITIYMRPFFGKLLQRHLEMTDLLSTSGILSVLTIVILIIAITGSYPAYRLTKISLIHGLKGKSENINRKRTLSAVSVVVQFAITVFLISTVTIITSQVKYLKKQPLGFNPENIVQLDGFNRAIYSNPTAVCNALKRLPFVEDVASSSHAMGGGYSGQGLKKYGDPGAMKSINQYRIQPGFCDLMGIELPEGRPFREDGSDNQAVILNEKAVAMMELENPIGTLVQMNDEPLTVIGVAKDFFYWGHPGEPVEPLMLSAWTPYAQNIYIKYNGVYTPEMQQQVIDVMKQFDPEYIYKQDYLTDIFQRKYHDENRLIRLVTTGAIVAIILSFMGLMALSIMQVHRRTKEVGIRKVMGSSVIEIMLLLMKETLIVVSVAVVIAFVASWWVMHSWLIGFTDHITLHAGYFLVSIIAALLIVLLATGWQTWRAATGNPVKALRYE
jgi:putative ABC transport system permease protein